MVSRKSTFLHFVRRIKASGLTIYDALTQRPDLYLSTDNLQRLLQKSLVGLSLDYPLRTRSKIVKTALCKALGYPVPDRFRRVRPRFPGQNLDIYVQKSNNLQIWNEEIAVGRRYAMLQLNNGSRVTAVRVVTGDVIASLDLTGTLTRKYQAAARKPVTSSILVVTADTSHLRTLLKPGRTAASAGIRFPGRRFLSIRALYRKLLLLAGWQFNDPGVDQERIRGAILHEKVMRLLGDNTRSDSGQFPDVLDQLLELKFQTSPTIDLGLVSPDSMESLTLTPCVRHRDVRYAVFYATPSQGKIRIDHVIVSTGESFFKLFRKFGGRVVNRKLQIRLPDGFFAQTE
ncbi:MAG: hypothetical protein A2Z34_05635 [Planctomycetes bacterium RBG_16_59_8]|nr:MAG: hypothetical protein A2Z34_05635 [Planctomycetes bacterium RBG_16_59_8]